MKIQVIILLLTYCALVGCGVRGDPQPPLKPTEIGRGRPTYKKATENISLPKQNFKKDKDWDEETVETEENEEEK